MTRSKVLNTVAIYKLEIVNTYNKLIFRLEMNRRAIEQAIVFTLQMGNGKWEMAISSEMPTVISKRIGLD